VRPRGSHYVVCIANKDYPASLLVRRLYRVLPDRAAEKHDLRRVVDDSEEDYLYPKSFFATISLPRSVIRKLAAATR
jgi:hypothetical protein